MTTTKNSECCVCLPYNDGSLIAAQILSIIAMFLNWIDPVTGWIGFVAFLCLQIVWCCKMNKCGLITVGVISSIASLANLIIGILVLSGGLGFLCKEAEKECLLSCMPSQDGEGKMMCKINLRECVQEVI